MGLPGHILLTGATGFLGRYLLRELLIAGCRVAVLARSTTKQPALERIAALHCWCEESTGRRLTTPTVLSGDLTVRGLGLLSADRRWIGAHCQCVLHAAARTGMRKSPDGEPARTNVEGTQQLLELCVQLGIAEFHHVSTAFVCGNRSGPIYECELDRGQEFRNEYEWSKCEAELRVRQTQRIRATIYRPSVIVGDSQTGHTSSYQGFYRFLELADRLAEPAENGHRVLPLRLPFQGDEPRNLVPVDWVARAIVSIRNQSARHGQTYHLVAPMPVQANAIKRIAEEVLRIDGVRWAGPGEFLGPSAAEELFLGGLQEYRPYFQGDPVFDCRNTLAALPDLPAPRVDHALLTRLIRFAIADGWGRTGRREHRDNKQVNCPDYIERFFPEAAPHSRLARLPLNAVIAFDIGGTGGGQWSCEWHAGRLVNVRRGMRAEAEATYRLDVATFAAIVEGKLTPPDAFFARRIEIHGHIEKALKLAVLFGSFVQEFPYSAREETHVAVCPG